MTTQKNLEVEEGIGSKLAAGALAATIGLGGMAAHNRGDALTHLRDVASTHKTQASTPAGKATLQGMRAHLAAKKAAHATPKTPLTMTSESKEHFHVLKRKDKKTGFEETMVHAGNIKDKPAGWTFVKSIEGSE